MLIFCTTNTILFRSWFLCWTVTKRSSDRIHLKSFIVMIFCVFTVIETCGPQQKILWSANGILWFEAWLFTYLPCTQLQQFVHNSKIAITLLSHLCHESTLLLSASSFKLLAITLAYSSSTFSSLLSNVSFYFKNFSLKFSIFSVVGIICLQNYNHQDFSGILHDYINLNYENQRKQCRLLMHTD